MVGHLGEVMDMIHDPKEVEKLAKDRWEENLALRKWMREQDPHQMDDLVDQVAKEVSAQIDCTKCAKCCRALTIHPKPMDVQRLALHLDFETNEFKHKYLKKDHEGDLVFRQRPCPFLKGDCCSVYQARPDTCRSYPHLEKTHMTGRGWYIVENTLLCPIVFNTYEGLRAHFGLERALQEANS